MTEKQPEALRLADAIDPLTRKFLDNLTCKVAADELRRLHAENERLKEVKREASFDRVELWLGRIHKAVKEEREACAQVCDDMVLYTGYDCAAAIRARI